MPDDLSFIFGSTRKQDFYIQHKPKEPWHIESEENCEIMLCGLFISVEANTRISNTGGPLRCADCWMIHERMKRTIFQ